MKISIELFDPREVSIKIGEDYLVDVIERNRKLVINRLTWDDDTMNEGDFPMSPDEDEDDLYVLVVAE
jgi:hypothetical protein